MKKTEKIKGFRVWTIWLFAEVAYAYLPYLKGKEMMLPLQENASLNQSNNQQLNVWMQFSKGFEPNLGQVGDFNGKKVKDVLFFIEGKGFSLFLKRDGISYVIYQIEAKAKGSSVNWQEYKRDGRLHYARIDLDLLNANIKKSDIVYEEPLPGYSNYYLSHCLEGVLNVKRFRKVIVKNVYSGINWVFRYDEEGRFHHEFEISAGADTNQISFKVKWADVEIREDGKKVVFSTPLGKIEDGKIVSYEGLKDVDVRYKLKDGVISYYVRNWSGRDKLFIDPPLSLIWATYYGGDNDDYGIYIKIDFNDNVFVTGSNYSTEFPIYNPGGGAYFQGTIAGAQDAFILKFSNSGIRLWATYYGGAADDWGYSIATDASGNVFITGGTGSTDFPVYDPGGGAYFQGTKAGYSDAFILKFNNSGIRLWATYYGGNNDNEGDYGLSIASDSFGNVFVTGNAGSTDFPLYDSGNGAYFQGIQAGSGDSFMLKFSNSGVRLWATYYGGNSYDNGCSISIDAFDNVFITGYTYSSNFPVYDPGGGAYFQGTISGLVDVFVLKFSNSGVRLWATYYGGSSEDDGEYGVSITTDYYGNVFITGWTLSVDFPVYDPGNGAYFQGVSAGNSEVFILKFSNSGVRLWATYYGGSSDDHGFCITTDYSGNVFVTGWTYLTGFPVYDPGGGAYFQGENAGFTDAFILKFTNNGVRLWATYYGGSSYDNGRSIVTDYVGNVFVSGASSSINLPLHNPGGDAYFQGTNAGLYDAFILKFETSIYIQNPTEAGKPMICQKNADSSITCNYTNGGSCATDNVIYYGSLLSVSSYSYSGSICNAGTSGSITFNLGEGDWFWLIVSNNGVKEGSYGKDSNGGERPEASGIGLCDYPQDLNNTCN